GVSGSAFDRRHGFAVATAANERIDVIIGDWMSEGNMVSTSQRKLDRAGDFGYEKSFLSSIEASLSAISRKGIKVVVNAGASDPEALAVALDSVIRDQQLPLQTAWVSGDEVLHPLQEALKKGESALLDIRSYEKLPSLPQDTVYAQAYLGAGGIAKGLQLGADIIICGRVADASLVIGAAIWWHNWTPNQHQELASALVTGHLIECSTYITGGNFSGFKSLPESFDPGFPVAEVDQSGGAIITKLDGSGGCVTEDTVTAQLLYEIQGPLYYNSDVTAKLHDITLRTVGQNRVQVLGVSGSPPPPTTKVGITTKRYYKAELHWSLVGLDIEAKANLLKQNILSGLGKAAISNLSLLHFDTYGVAEDNPKSQNAATVDFRVFAQAPLREQLSPENFMQPILDVIMSSYPGATPQPAITSGLPQPYSEYNVALMPQNVLEHSTHFNGEVYKIAPPLDTFTYPPLQESYDPANPVDLETFGDTVMGPLGWIIHGRSGDKGPNANVGLWARDEEEYSWLRSILTISYFKEILGAEYKTGERIERVEFHGLHAVHFLLHNHLDRGINSTSTYDILGKNVAEYIRARHVPLPRKFLERGRI
ncbi:DUF1446-domain-containing protein, partial [Corynespora cassiicola Philippines]